MFDVLLFHQCINQKNAIMYLLEIDSAQGFWHLLVTIRDQRALSRTILQYKSNHNNSIRSYI